MAIWSEKQYNRINWKNRPSTTTPLGQTNLNKVDVFCNSVDNALIQFDAQKLNISVANSMLASVSYNDDTGVWTFKTLAGTTYTYNQNIEKIPVSFTLTEDGILVMTTEDGTEWECNIADLIKDYVFDDSETVAFEKEFVGTDDDGKGSYHVSASVKAGSINEMHLNPDYRADILTYKTQAQEAANDSLTYSKDSKRWAVGDAEYEGSATDNSKYYKEQAEAAKKAAEQARDEAQAATGAVIATTTQLGVVKPDGTTIGVEEDGTIKSIIKAASLLITDNQELVVEKQGEVAQETTTQALIDAIADKVANQLVTNTALTSQLANYVTKAMMSNVQVNDQNKVPTSALAYAMQQQITYNEDAISVLNSKTGAYQSNNSASQAFTELPREWCPDRNGGGGFDFRMVMVDSGTIDPHSPENSSPPEWYNVITFGRNNRCYQVACEVYPNKKIWFRVQHDNTVYGWYELTTKDDLPNIHTEYNVTNNNILLRCTAEDGSAIQLATTGTQIQLQKRTSSSGSFEIVWTK